MISCPSSTVCLPAGYWGAFLTSVVIIFFSSQSSCFGKCCSKITGLRCSSAQTYTCTYHFISGCLICDRGSNFGDKYQNRANLLHVFQIYSMANLLQIRDFFRCVLLLHGIAIEGSFFVYQLFFKPMFKTKLPIVAQHKEFCVRVSCLFGTGHLLLSCPLLLEFRETNQLILCWPPHFLYSSCVCLFRITKGLLEQKKKQ